MRTTRPTEFVITHFHLFSGSGGLALGMQRGQVRLGQSTARFRCLGGIDSDPAACEDMERFLGVPATCLDLFDREQYTAFHGQAPPPSFKEATAADIRAAAQGQRPDILGTCPPCKSFSLLLSQKDSEKPKYQALSRLTLRGVQLALSAWPDDPIPLFVMENVLGIQHQRGRAFLDEIRRLLCARGYAVAESQHDCGELGGLGEHRRRFLLVARHMKSVPVYLYEPPKLRVRAIGEILTPMPMPEAPGSGPMHTLPRLTWETWKRLALIPAGGDWRSLPGMQPRDPAARKRWEQKGERTAGERHLFKGKNGVQPWQQAGRTVIGGGSNGSAHVADPRPLSGEYRQYGVVDFSDTFIAVTGQSAPGGGPYSVAEPRWNRLGVVPLTSPMGTVTAEAYPTNGPFSVADARWHSDVLGILRWTEPAATVTGRAKPSTGAFSVAAPLRTGPLPDGSGPDPAPPGAPYYHLLRVGSWGTPAGCVTGATRPAGGALSVADPNPLSLGGHDNKMRVEDWTRAAHTVTGSDRVGSGAPSVADPRPQAGPAGAPPPESGTGLDCRTPSGARVYQVFAYERRRGGLWTAAPTPMQTVLQIVPWRHQIRAPGGWQPPADIPLIISTDGCWHRPVTTLELAAIQDLPWQDLLARPMQGRSHTAWRARIGNLVPPGAAQAIGQEMGKTLLLVWTGLTFVLSVAPIWVEPEPADPPLPPPAQGPRARPRPVS